MAKQSPALTWITKEAKRLKKVHPNSKWTSLVKKAGAAYRAKHKGKTIGATRKTVTKKAVKRAPRKAIPRKVKDEYTTTHKRVIGAMPSLGTLLAKGRKILIDQIGTLEAKKFAARTKTEKNRLQKEITKKKLQVRKFM